MSRTEPRSPEIAARGGGLDSGIPSNRPPVRDNLVTMTSLVPGSVLPVERLAAEEDMPDGYVCPAVGNGLVARGPTDDEYGGRHGSGRRLRRRWTRRAGAAEPAV